MFFSLRYFIIASLFLVTSYISFSQVEIGKKIVNDSLFLKLKESLIEAEKFNDINILSEEIISVSEYYKRRSEYSKAVRIVTVYMLKLPENNLRGRALCLLELGELNRAIEEHYEARVFLFDALEIFKQIKDSKGIGEAYNRLAAVFFEEKKFDFASQFSDSSMTFSEQINDSILIASNLEIKGAILHSRQDYKNATKCFLDVISIYNQLNIEPDANVYINLCITYLLMKDYNRSIYYGENAYRLAKKQGVLIYIENACVFLSEAYSKQGNYEKAYVYNREAYSATIRLFNERKNIEILELNKQYENEKIRIEIDSQKFKLEQRSKLTYLFILLFIILSAGIVISSVIGKKIKKTNKLLQVKNNEITMQREQIELQADKIKQKAADLMVLNMQLKELDSLKDGLTAMLVHDLKNPISNILSISKDKEVLSFANQMLVLVSNILDVQKYESARMKLEIHDYYLNSILKNAIEQVLIIAEHKNIKIKIENKFSFQVAVDYEIIQRVIVNLLTNSIKYTPHNGIITINCMVDPKNESYVEISVKDNGIGIKKDKINAIFNKFNQIIAKNSGHARSTGLGLTFCKLAVEAHDGEISVISDQGNYTIFKFTIPISGKELKRVINPQNNGESSGIILSLKDKKLLEDIVLELKKTEVYDIGNLRKLTQKIDESSSPEIETWKRELNRSIYNCNPEYYNELIKIAGNENNKE
jgi:signal transduction histidine kinase